MAIYRTAIIIDRQIPGCTTKPVVDRLIGKEFLFEYGWLIDKDERPIYAGEDAWLFANLDEIMEGLSEADQADMPIWIASGDLQFTESAWQKPYK